MPDKRQHRGAHPQDAVLFAPAAWPGLRAAVAELSWLLTRGYAMPSSLKLVGDRYNLTERQRTAVMRCACTDEARRSRLARQADINQVSAQTILIDAYNVLTSIETALGGGVILVARDTCWRDMASIHGTYRKVEETQPALKLAGEVLASIGTGTCVWYLDSPVSNSGRLAQIMREIASQNHWDWRIELVPSADAVLAQTQQIVASADSIVLDRCGAWINLVRQIIRGRIASANVVNLCYNDGGSLAEGEQ